MDDQTIIMNLIEITMMIIMMTMIITVIVVVVDNFTVQKCVDEPLFLPRKGAYRRTHAQSAEESVHWRSRYSLPSIYEQKKLSILALLDPCEPKLPTVHLIVHVVPDKPDSPSHAPRPQHLSVGQRVVCSWR